MNSCKHSGPLPKTRKYGSMSYMYGPHMNADEIYFGGDGRTCRRATNCEESSPPAWLVADWLMAHKRGEALSPYARSFLDSGATNQALRWFRDFLNQYEDT